MIAFIRSLEILGPSGPRLLFLGALRATDTDAETPSSNIVPRTIIFTLALYCGLSLFAGLTRLPGYSGS